MQKKYIISPIQFDVCFNQSDLGKQLIFFQEENGKSTAFHRVPENFKDDSQEIQGHCFQGEAKA